MELPGFFWIKLNPVQIAFQNLRQIMNKAIVYFSTVFLTISTLSVSAQIYWDKNGATAGAGGATPTGVWGTDAFWSSSSTGEAATLSHAEHRRVHRKPRGLRLSSDLNFAGGGIGLAAFKYFYAARAPKCSIGQGDSPVFGLHRISGGDKRLTHA